MKRDLISKLIDWKDSNLRKPLILLGARQFGKTYLLKDFGKSNYQNTAYISFESNQEYLEIFKRDKNPNRIIKELSYLLKLKIEPQKTLIIFDDVQKAPDVICSLKYFCEDANEYHIACAATSLENSSLQHKVFPVGKVNFLDVYPLTFSEFVQGYDGSIDDALNEYITYGGMPRILSFKTEADKSDYLKRLFEHTYLKDIIERNNVQRIDVLDALVNILASSIGSLTNPNKLVNTFESYGIKDVSVNTLTTYINYLLDAFLITKAERYDVKGKKHILTPYKYYFADIGLRNSRLNFRQQEETHIMENIIFNELLYRGYNVDVGVVEIREGTDKKQVEVDFICNQFNKKYYIQSALSLPTREKTLQEERPLLNIQDNFKKIIVVKDNIKSWITEEGIVVIGLKEFLLNPNSLDL